MLNWHEQRLREQRQRRKKQQARSNRSPFIRIVAPPHQVSRSGVAMLAGGRGTMHRILGGVEQRRQLLSPNLRWQQVIVARHRGRIVGFAAFKCYGRGGPYLPTLKDFIATYGLGGILRWCAFWLVESRDIRAPFYLYGLKIDPRYRGHGISRRLLDAARDEALRRKARYIELEVIDRHAHAERIYTHYGYVLHHRRNLGWLSRFLGFRSVSVMRLPLD